MRVISTQNSGFPRKWGVFETKSVFVELLVTGFDFGQVSCDGICCRRPGSFWRAGFPDFLTRKHGGVDEDLPGKRGVLRPSTRPRGNH